MNFDEAIVWGLLRRGCSQSLGLLVRYDNLLRLNYSCFFDFGERQADRLNFHDNKGFK